MNKECKEKWADRAALTGIAGLLAVTFGLVFRSAFLENKVSATESEKEKLRQECYSLSNQLYSATNQIPNQTQRTINALNYAEQLNHTQTQLK